MRLKCALLLLALMATVAFYVLTARPFTPDRERLAGAWGAFGRGKVGYRRYLILRPDGTGASFDAGRREQERWESVHWAADESSKHLTIIVQRRKENTDIGGAYQLRSGWTWWGYFGEHLRVETREEGVRGLEFLRRVRRSERALATQPQPG